MGWKEYYQTSPESYYCRVGHGLLKRILEGPSCSPLAQKESLRLVLGGFSPYSSTAAAFVKDCVCYRPQKQDEIYLLDLNRQPLAAAFSPSLPKEKKLFRLQADLARMPFDDKSLDLIWLDGTTNFMDDKKLASFGKEANRTLANEGVAISVFNEPIASFWPSFCSSRESLVNRTSVYPRSAKTALSLLKDLKLVWHLEGNRETALVFAPKDSPYAPFSGRPFDLETASENF